MGLSSCTDTKHEHQDGCTTCKLDHVLILKEIQSRAVDYYESDIPDSVLSKTWAIDRLTLNWHDCRIGLDSFPNRVYSVPLTGQTEADCSLFILFTFDEGSMNIKNSHLVKVNYEENGDLTAKFLNACGEEQAIEVNNKALFSKKRVLTRYDIDDIIVWACSTCGYFYAGDWPLRKNVPYAFSLRLVS